MNIRQGIIGGVTVSVIVSATMMGASADSFWGPLLTSLAFSLACVGAVIGLAVLVSRPRTDT